MTTPSSVPSPSSLLNDGFNQEMAFKQFSLETEHLELVYHRLEERFTSVQTLIHESKTRMAGKLAELDFVSHYLETILNHISQGIIFLDLNGCVTTCNFAAARILQIDEKKILFHSYTEFFDDHFFGFSLKEVFASKISPRSGSVSFKREQESLELEVEALFVSMSHHSFPLDHSHPSLPIQGLLILFRDVTKLRRLQENAQHHDRLKELGELAAHLAHEIRNPLGGIKGFASILKQELKDEPDLQQMASYIVQGADTLNQFVNEILHYSRPYQTHFETVEIMPFIQEVLQLVQVDSSWNPKIHVNVAQVDLNLSIPLDVQLFKSALLNLFLNANQAMPEGGELSIEVVPSDAVVAFRIQDTGVGIPEENLSKIFSPFFTTKEAGTGLGLAEVQKAVQAHNGRIEVQSELGKGTLFIIRIPLKIEE